MSRQKWPALKILTYSGYYWHLRNHGHHKKQRHPAWISALMADSAPLLVQSLQGRLHSVRVIFKVEYPGLFQIIIWGYEDMSKRPSLGSIMKRMCNCVSLKAWTVYIFTCTTNKFTWLLLFKIVLLLMYKNLITKLHVLNRVPIRVRCECRLLPPPRPDP